MSLSLILVWIMELRRMLVVSVVRLAFRLLFDGQNAGELLRDLKVRVRVEMPVGSERGLYLLVPKALLKEQGAFPHVDEQGCMGVS